VSSLVSPYFLSQMKSKFDDGEQSYVFKPVKKVIVRPQERSLTFKATQEIPLILNKEQSGYPLNDSLLMNEPSEYRTKSQLQNNSTEETYNPLKLPRYETYKPLDKKAYLDSVRSVGSKVGSFRKPNKSEKAR